MIKLLSKTGSIQDMFCDFSSFLFSFMYNFYSSVHVLEQLAILPRILSNANVLRVQLIVSLLIRPAFPRILVHKGLIREWFHSL
jgi:hypothetical protein